MKVIADLHIHSRFSRATSKDITIKNLEKYSRIKGIGMIGTGDFTHPLWLKELKSELEEDGSGILKTKTGFSFVLQSELSLIYTQDGKGRKVHNVMLAKSFEVVDQINEALLKRGRLDYDGRPIFGMSCIEFVDLLKGIDEDIEIIPAHIWTPWFSLFGSNSGFDSIKDCFKEKVNKIHALETGLSSDPAMNWRLSQLDDFSLVSFSDIHSFWPWRIGREATIFDIKLTYKNLINALKTKEGLVETIEVDPNYGKYHYDGHRDCNISLSPAQTKKCKGICPKCGKKLTIGVLYRVEELADREDGYMPKNAPGFKSLIPLSEIISGIIGAPVAGKNTWQEYNKLLDAFGSEFKILLDATYSELLKSTDEKIAKAIIDAREGRIKINPGYDGVYGEPIFSSEKRENKEIKTKHFQKGLEEFC